MKKIIVIAGIILIGCSLFSCKARQKCAAYANYSSPETVEVEQIQS